MKKVNPETSCRKVSNNRSDHKRNGMCARVIFSNNCNGTIVSQVPRDICAPSNCVFKNTEKVTFSKHKHNFEELKVKITNMSRFAATRHASLCRTSPRRSATSSPGRIVRWRLSLCRGDLSDDIYVVMKCKSLKVPT